MEKSLSMEMFHTQFTNTAGLSSHWLTLPFFVFCIPTNKNKPLFILGSPKNGVKEELDFHPAVSPPPPVRADVTSMCSFSAIPFIS